MDQYSLPRINDLSAKLFGATIFTKLDLLNAYNQISMHPDDICKTAVTTPFGLFEFIKMPLGLNNFSQTCQRYMDQAL